MKKPLFLIAALAFSFAGCAGHAGGGSSMLPAAGGTASAPDLSGGVLSPDFVNTSLPYYMPLMKNNIWSLAANTPFGTMTATIQDVGPYQVNNHADTGTWQSLSKDEQLDVYGPTGYAGSLYVRKVTFVPSGHEMTTVTGESTNGNTATPTVTLFKAPMYPLGVPIMDDTPHKGEHWNVAMLGATSTIDTLVNHIPYRTGQYISNVAENVLYAPGSQVVQDVTWRFAKGVGPVQIELQGYVFQLTSFNIGRLHSHAVGGPSAPVSFHVSNQRFSLDFLNKLIPAH